MSMTKDMMNPAFTPEQVASREFLRFMVSRNILCPISGALLDNRTAVLLEATIPEGAIDPRIVAPEVWAENGPGVIAKMAELGATLTVTEGAS